MRLAPLTLLVASSLLAIACGGATAEPISDKSTHAATANTSGNGNGHSEDPGTDSCGSLTENRDGGAPSVGDPCATAPTTDECEEGAKQRCSVATSSSSGDVSEVYRVCTRNADGVLVWGQCGVDPSNPPTEAASSSTPLVVVFDGAPVTYATAPSATFDLAGDGASHATDWPTARTPWLALDRDGNGRIDDGSELFGSMTRLATGLHAKNGFEALAELDSNHDGAITADDDAFASLVLWADGDADRVANASELQPARDTIVRIDLRYRSEPRCTASGNCEVERASLTFRTADGSLRTGAIVDIHLRHR